MDSLVTNISSCTNLEMRPHRTHRKASVNSENQKENNEMLENVRSFLLKVTHASILLCLRYLTLPFFVCRAGPENNRRVTASTKHWQDLSSNEFKLSG